MIAEYFQSETVVDFLYVTCFCNVYAWILIKYQLHFVFLVVFTPLLTIRPLVNPFTMSHDYCIVEVCISFFCTTVLCSASLTLHSAA